MIITLDKTTAAAVGTELLHARRNLGVASGMVFTLVAVCERSKYAEVLAACLEAGREHPSRILIVVPGAGKRSRLDAEIRTGEEIAGDVVTLRVTGELAVHADSVVLPLLLPDSPVIAWWPYAAPEAPGEDPIGKLADRRVTDAAGCRKSLEAMRLRAVEHVPGDTDLTWTRLTPWRALLAAALDQYPAKVTGARVEAARGNAPAELLAAWLETRLKVEIAVKTTRGPGITAVRLEVEGGEIAIERGDGVHATYVVPDQPRRKVALARRSMNELITEELRRMDPDDIFEAAMTQLIKRARRAGIALPTARSKRKSDLPATTAKQSSDRPGSVPPGAKPRKAAE